ncbi:MAG TPA: DEAD/DEAH box helicase, partial [Acidimicrobiia bacterium]|nr:DEAD/DEAH box helicase [Acidimicrobiia bacterium]
MSRIDFSDVYGGLKDFQRTTVDHVFKRMYLDDKPAHRFLIADEVGLGKTLVARGLIAKAVEHLNAQGVRRIDVIYICSNAEIAAQNIKRLSLPGFEHATYASRLTMLPLELRDLSKNRLNFISFTPSTALDLKGNLGRREERVLLYWLLKKKWPDLVGTKTGPMRIFQGKMGSIQSFRNLYKWYESDLRAVDRGLRERFFRDLDEHDRRARKRGELTLKARFEHLATAWAYKGKKTPEEGHERSVFVGELRSLLARTCIGTLEPDLVILDEFQRFRHLLDEGSEAAELAHSLFNYTSADGEARVLLLSATPYKMFTLAEESLDDDHYRDFLRTIGFLMNGKTRRFTEHLADYRRQLLQLDPDHLDPLLEARKRIENSLRKVMSRTERLAVGDDRNGMLTEVLSNGVHLVPKDMMDYVALDRAATRLESPQPMEYWKSAPYFANFWDGYQIGRQFQLALATDPPAADEVRQFVKNSLIPWNDFENYQQIDPGNSRLRELSTALIDKGAWKLLWLPPCLPYYQLGKPFAQAGRDNLTKRLVFSAWNVAPRVVSSMLSYEAERRMMTARKQRGLVNSPDARARIPEPLRFPVKQTTGMSA